MSADKKKVGSVTVTGPASCLPAVSVNDEVMGHADKGWKLKSLQLTLDGHKVGKQGSIDGAAYVSGSSHTLVGKAVFKKKPKKHHHGHHRAGLRPRGVGRSHGHHGHGHHGHGTKTVTVSLTFRVC